MFFGALFCVGRSFIFNFAARYHKEQPVVTIFIHGSRSGIRYFLPAKFKAKPGLLSVKEYEESSYYFQMADVLEKKSPKRYNKDHFYIFGWDGTVDFTVRKKMAKKLYNKIKKRLRNYKTDLGVYPKLQIITFSHGGNIALQLSDFLPFFNNDSIDLDLVLIGCPVQAATENLIDCPHFSHITVISSNGDVIQRMDPHNLYGPKRDKKTRVFSRRFFDVCDLDQSVQNKISQCAVTVNRKVIGHLDLSRSFIKHVPDVLDQSIKAAPGKILDVDIYDPEFAFCSFYNLFF